MKFQMLLVLCVLVLCLVRVRGGPLTRGHVANRGREGRKVPSRLPFLVRLPPSTTPCQQRICFGRMQTRLPFLALPQELQTTTQPPAMPKLALVVYESEPSRLPGLVRCPAVKQTTQMTTFQRNIEQKKSKKRVTRNIFEAYAREQGIPEHGSVERMEMIKQMRSRISNEYWTSAVFEDLIDDSDTNLDYDTQIESGTDLDDAQYLENEDLEKSDSNAYSAIDAEDVAPMTLKPFEKKTDVKLQTRRPKTKKEAKKKSLSSPLDVAFAIGKQDDKDTRFKRYKDDLEAFGHYVATSLRKLSDNNIINAQDEIQAILSRYKVRNLKRTVYYDLFS